MFRQSQLKLQAQRSHRRTERGVTLIVVLLILLIVMTVGIGAARIALLGERSSRFDRDYQVAFQSAEAALMDAEFDIFGPNTSSGARLTTFRKENTIDFVSGCGTGAQQGLCEMSTTGKPIWYQVDFTATGTSARTVEFGAFTGRDFAAASGSTNAGVKPAKKPRYIVEVATDRSANTEATYSEAKASSKIYRVTAMGFGPREDIQAVLQMTFKKEE